MRAPAAVGDQFTARVSVHRLSGAGATFVLTPRDVNAARANVADNGSQSNVGSEIADLLISGTVSPPLTTQMRIDTGLDNMTVGAPIDMTYCVKGLQLERGGVPPPSAAQSRWI